MPDAAKTGKPKRQLTAYNIFFKDQRQLILVEGDGASGGFAKLARTIAARWKRIEPEQYQMYLQKAAADKIRYNNEMDVWKPKPQQRCRKKKAKSPRSKVDRSAHMRGVGVSSDWTGSSVAHPSIRDVLDKFSTARTTPASHPPTEQTPRSFRASYEQHGLCEDQSLFPARQPSSHGFYVRPDQGRNSHFSYPSDNGAGPSGSFSSCSFQSPEFDEDDDDNNTKLDSAVLDALEEAYDLDSKIFQTRRIMAEFPQQMADREAHSFGDLDKYQEV